MTVTRTHDNRWQVVDGSNVLAAPFATMADAWRWIDRQKGEPVNKSEDTAAWSWTKRVHGE